MVKVVQSNLLNSLALALCITFAACARSARDLPPDLSALEPSQRLLSGDRLSSEYKMPCEDLLHELDSVKAEITSVEAKLQRIRDSNQSKSVAGALILTPIWLTMDNAKEAKKTLDELESRKERIERIAQARDCKR